MKIVIGFCAVSSLFAAVSMSAVAREVYKPPTVFLNEVFDNQRPEPKLVWLVGNAKSAATDILGHPPEALRERYWSDQGTSAWILDEVGKSRPITVGIVVRNQQIQRLDVLIYRESRGWEVRYPVFTRQFQQAALKRDGQLDQDIDGITGATLSVNAVVRLARLALYLDNLASGS